jgi:hypothetical protein
MPWLEVLGDMPWLGGKRWSGGFGLLICVGLCLLSCIELYSLNKVIEILNSLVGCSLL